jgi:hypothetical protein
MNSITFFQSLFLLCLIFSLPATADENQTIPVQTTEYSHFYCVDNIYPNNELIILIHGWSFTQTFGAPLKQIKNYYEAEWKNFIDYFEQYKNRKICLYTWDVRNGIETPSPLSQVLLKLHTKYKVPYNKIHILAHSQGGNYSKQALVDLYLEKQNDKVRDIDLVTLGTPHKGSESLYLRNVAMMGEAIGIIGVTSGAVYSFHRLSENAETEAAKNLYNTGKWVSGILGSAYLAYRFSRFSKDYQYPGLMQLRPLKENPLLRIINDKVIYYQLNNNIYAIYSDYNSIGGDVVVSIESGSWEGVKLKNRQLFTERDHLDLIEGDADIFAYIEKIIFDNKGQP